MIGSDIDTNSNTGARMSYFNIPIPIYDADKPLETKDWDWHKIIWGKVEHLVENLQKRIYKAVKQGRRNVARKLGQLLLKSSCNILVNVRRVTQDNTGKKTAGVDRIKSLSPVARKKLVEEIIALSKRKWKKYQARPIRRIYIPKLPDKLRPLGIPTIKDRAIQGVEKTVIEPYWEALFEPNSYGFRIAFRTQDAIEAIFNNLKCKQKWVLDADIKGCFDNIAHAPLLEKLEEVPGRVLIKKWLQAGIMENGKIYPSETGTPQGGIISPLLANIAMDGMERSLLEKLRQYQDVKIVRYADDFVVLHEDKAVIEIAKEFLQQWLTERGLELSETKTKIIHSSEGFDFLGFNIKHFPKAKKGYIASKIQRETKQDFKLIIQPERKKIKAHIQKISDIIEKSKANSAERLIQLLQRRITGWANYYRFCCYSDAFSEINHWLRHKLWVWALRRHPNKGPRWVARKYFSFTANRAWQFKDDKGKVLNMHKGSRERYVKIRAGKSYFDGDTQYWAERLSKGYGDITPSKAKMMVKQNYRCPYCGRMFISGQKMETHHVIQKISGGLDNYGNLILMHKHCHDQYHAEYLMLKKNLKKEKGSVFVAPGKVYYCAS